jgi:hypothetical protein
MIQTSLSQAVSLQKARLQQFSQNTSKNNVLLATNTKPTLPSIQFGKMANFETSEVLPENQLAKAQQSWLNKAFETAGVWQRSLSVGISSMPSKGDKLPNGTFNSELPELMRYLGMNSLIPLPVGDTSPFYEEGIGKDAAHVKHPAPYSNGNITIAPWQVDPYLFTTPAYGQLLSKADVEQELKNAKKDTPAVPGHHLDMDETHTVQQAIFKKALAVLDRQPNNPLWQEWRNFLQEEKDWLKPYSKVVAISKVVKDDEGQTLSPDPERWPDRLKAYVRKTNPKSLLGLGSKTRLQVKAAARQVQFDQFIAEKAYKTMALEHARQGIGVGVDITTGEGKAFTAIYPEAFLREAKGKVLPFGYDKQPWNLPSLDITSQQGQDLIRLKMRRSLKTLKYVQEQLKKENKSVPPFTVRLDAAHTIFGGLGYTVQQNAKGELITVPTRMATPKSPDFKRLESFALIDPNNLQHLINEDDDGQPLDPANPGYIKTRAEAKRDGVEDVFNQLMKLVQVPMDIIQQSIRDANIPDKSVCYELLGPPNYFGDEFGKKNRHYVWTQDEGSHESVSREPMTNARIACYGSHDKPLAKTMIRTEVEKMSGKPEKPRLTRMLDSLRIPKDVREKMYYQPVNQFRQLDARQQDCLLDRMQELELAYVLNNTNRSQLLLANLLKTSAQHPDYVQSADQQDWLQVPGEYSTGSWGQLYSNQQLRNGLVNMPRIMKMVVDAKEKDNHVENPRETKQIKRALSLLASHQDTMQEPAKTEEDKQRSIHETRSALERLVSGHQLSLQG